MKRYPAFAFFAVLTGLWVALGVTTAGIAMLILPTGYDTSLLATIWCAGFFILFGFLIAVGIIEEIMQ